METKKKPSGPSKEMLEELRRDPDVRYYRRKDGKRTWTFKPQIRVKPGTDVLAIIENTPRRSYSEK